MTKMTSDSIADFMSRLGSSIKSLVKIALYSRRCSIRKAAGENERIIILGNGPSLDGTIKNDLSKLQASPSLAVNFAANADEFHVLAPRYYVLADPHFFNGRNDPNVKRLHDNINRKVNWEMTLFVPSRYRKAMDWLNNPEVGVEYFNPIGAEGFRWLTDIAYRTGRGMPRPRNVLIPSIMIAILLGYKEIYLAGADHSWMKTISVDDCNRVISVQPHFYKDNDDEKNRVATTYMNYRLHDIVHSFYVAFKAYHEIAAYSATHNIHIYNATPGSFIDAFERRRL